jgi:adhesin/invasin
MGTITSQAVTSNGIATATFTAANTPGTVTVTATTGGISQIVAIIITAPLNGSVQFVSATPPVIGIKGGGQPAVSNVKFLVNDINGNPVVNGTSVNFTMNGPSGGKLPSNGGEYIGDLDTTPTTATASTLNGYATVNLNSGTVAGPVTITASVTSGTQTLSASTSVISIGGGIPSATHFSLATTKFNLPGLVRYGETATITAYIADRFGNYNVLEGTSVSFYTEAGAIDRNGVTDATGQTTSIIRTQAPAPATVTISASETALINYLNLTYGLTIPTDGSVKPRDGWVTVLATVQGEETFIDANGNGLYDAGESFTDIGEPFIDQNDNSVWDTGEFYVDSNGNGVYDGPNGIWDGPNCPSGGCQSNKMIWDTINLAFTGNTNYCAVTPTTFNLGTVAPATRSQTFQVMVGDLNLNVPVSETILVVTASQGTLAGTTNYTVPDVVPFGPLEKSFILSLPTSWILGSGSVTVKVTPPAPLVGCEIVIQGTFAP